MSSETRGHAIKARRLALGIKSLREFAEASGISREALTAIEKGSGTTASIERAEAWLDRIEAETGHDEPEKPHVMRVEVQGVYGAKALVFEAPIENIAELEAMVDRIMRRLAGEQGAGQ